MKEEVRGSISKDIPWKWLQSKMYTVLIKKKEDNMKTEIKIVQRQCFPTTQYAGININWCDIIIRGKVKWE